MTRTRPVRVLHLIDGLAGGGSERWIFDIVRLSRSERVRHRVATFHPDVGDFVYADKLRQLGAYGTQRGPAAHIEQGAIAPPNVTRRRPLSRELRVVRRIPSAAYRMLSESRSFHPDVIHAHLTHSFVLGLTLAALARRPLVHTVPCTVSQLRDAGLFWVPGLYTRSRDRVASFFTAYPSELRDLGVPAAKIHEVRGVVDVAAIDAIRGQRAAQRRSVRARIGAPEHAPLALSVGRLHPSKGHELGARAVAVALQRVPELHWVILGAGERQHAIEQLAAELGIAERTHLLGFIPEVLPYYAAADVYLRTNRLEAENLSSYQAMAVGLPVIGFDTGATTELLRTVGHGVLVRPGDAAAMGSALADLLLSPQRAADLAERGCAYAREELDVQRTIAMLSETYEALAAGAGHRGA